MADARSDCAEPNIIAHEPCGQRRARLMLAACIRARRLGATALRAASAHRRDPEATRAGRTSSPGNGNITLQRLYRCRRWKAA